MSPESQQAAHAASLAVASALADTHAISTTNAEGERQRKAAVSALHQASEALFRLATVERLHR